jgi:sugar phosphate isomerase/epimerase
MRLGLSTAAVPDWPLEAIVEACARRGLQAIELVAGHGHDVHPGAAQADVRAAGERMRERGIASVLLRPADAAIALEPATMRLAALLGAGVIVAGADVNDAALEAARAVAGAPHAALLLAHGTDAAEAERIRLLAKRQDCGLSWRVDPARDRLEELAATILDAAGAQLQHIHLLGSGPESAASEGRGIGALLATLALRGWDGALTLAPSSPDRLPVWRLWLGRASWGCGSRTGEDALVHLDVMHTKVS